MEVIQGDELADINVPPAKRETQFDSGNFPTEGILKTD
jgi:hypothetical protein